MKEAYGGSFMLWLFMFFFVIYITVLCVALQFAKTYRMKNKVVNLIEQYKYDIFKKEDSMDQILIDYYKTVPYTINEEHFDGLADKCNSDDSTEMKSHWVSYGGGTCIRTTGKDASSVYYQVEVYFVIELPLIFESGITIPIKGETTRILLD